MQCGFSLVVTNTCPINFYCHVGSSVSTTICCPKPRKTELNFFARKINIEANLLQLVSLTNVLNPWDLDLEANHYQDGISTLLHKIVENLNITVCKGMKTISCRNQTAKMLASVKMDWTTLWYYYIIYSISANPCSTGNPYRNGGAVMQCNPMNPQICPTGQYCHIGGDARTTVCCPATGTALVDEIFYEAASRRFYCLWLFCTIRIASMYDQCVRWLVCKLVECGLIISPFISKIQASRVLKHWVSAMENYRWTDITSTYPQKVANHTNIPVPVVIKITSRANTNVKKVARVINKRVMKSIFSDQINVHFRLVYVNACPSNEPLLKPSGEPLVCMDHSSCPKGYWCHFGSSDDTTMCCPGGTVWR